MESEERSKGERSSELIAQNKNVSVVNVITVKNEIAICYENERRNVRVKKKLKRGRFYENIQEVKRKNGVKDDVSINKNMIRQRMK